MQFGPTPLAIFQAQMNDFLQKMHNKFVFVYVENIVLFSKKVLVLHKPLEKQLLVKAEKCELQVQLLSFLGFVVSTKSEQSQRPLTGFEIF